MTNATKGSNRIFHDVYHYRTSYFNEIRGSQVHKGTDYGTVGKNLPQYPPLNGAIVREVVEREAIGDVRGCRVRMEWPALNLGMTLQHLAEGSINVKVGDRLSKQTLVGLTGMTGKNSDGKRVSTGVHAHVEVYYIDQGINANFDFEALDFDEMEEQYCQEEYMTKEEVKAIVRQVLEESSGEPSWWAAADWKSAQNKGITDGTKPQAVPTREQVAAMIMRAIS